MPSCCIHPTTSVSSRTSTSFLPTMGRCYTSNVSH
jgi:hypothetical protein